MNDSDSEESYNGNSECDDCEIRCKSRNDIVLSKIFEFSQEYMSKYDKSHNFEHIMRVYDTAIEIYNESEYPTANLKIIKMACLLHDVNGKYDYVNIDIYDLLKSFGANEETATKVNIICNNISYSHEINNQNNKEYKEIIKIPELRIVQDADRLDALGKIGIERCITYNNTKNLPMSYVINHFHDKLYKLDGMMKTKYGKKESNKRIEYLREFELTL